MSLTTPPAPQKLSILAAFQTAPTLAKVLASILYGVGLLTLVQMAVIVADYRLMILIAVTGTVTGTRTVLVVGVALAVLGLLLTPAVRRHCAKR